jgi:FAD/FMN-containing dehydrogenase
MQDSFIKGLAEIVGAKNVLTAENDTAPYTTDWRRQYRGAALGVVRPASTAEVSAVVRLCAGAGIAIVPQGGNTGLSGASVPTGRQQEIVLSLARMNRIRQLDALNDTLTAEAGCVLADIQRAAGDAGRLFALSLAAEGSCQIGGNLSTNAAASTCCATATCATRCSASRRCCPTGACGTGCAACARTTAATT